MQPAFIYANFGANMANFLVEQAELDRTDTIKGYYSLHDVTMDDRLLTSKNPTQDA